MTVLEIIEANAVICDGINRLLPQLSETSLPITAGELQNIIDADGSALIVALEDDSRAVLGCVVLSVFPILTDIRAWIDDLVVCSDARGRGIGRQLVAYAIKKAEEMGARSINLTCSPRRRSANALYRRIGFTHRQTHVYQLMPGSSR